MDKYIQVKGHSGLVRDRHSGAILNVNSTQMAQARHRKKVWKEQQQELEDLRNDVAEMKLMMRQIIEGNNGANGN